MIRRRLRGASFDEADIKRLTAAYEATLQLLRLNNTPDSTTDLIADKVIELFRAGEHNAPKICARVLTDLGMPLPEQGGPEAILQPPSCPCCSRPMHFVSIIAGKGELPELRGYGCHDCMEVVTVETTSGTPQ